MFTKSIMPEFKLFSGKKGLNEISKRNEVKMNTHKQLMFILISFFSCIAYSAEQKTMEQPLLTDVPINEEPKKKDYSPEMKKLHKAVKRCERSKFFPCCCGLSFGTLAVLTALVLTDQVKGTCPQRTCSADQVDLSKTCVGVKLCDNDPRQILCPFPGTVKDFSASDQGKYFSAGSKSKLCIVPVSCGNLLCPKLHQD